eukprot:8412122-Karenia_brevis.AAC.1
MLLSVGTGLAWSPVVAGSSSASSMASALSAVVAGSSWLVPSCSFDDCWWGWSVSVGGCDAAGLDV